MEDDLGLTLYSFIDLKNQPNTKNILHTFDRFFFAFGRFPVINKLTIVPTSNVSSFVQSNNAFYLLSYIKNLVQVMLENYFGYISQPH